MSTATCPCPQASKQASKHQFQPVSHVTLTARMSEELRCPLRKRQKTQKNKGLCQQPIGLTARHEPPTTTAHCSKHNEKQTQGSMQTCSHHQLAPVHVSHHMSFFFYESTARDQTGGRQQGTTHVEVSRKKDATGARTEGHVARRCEASSRRRSQLETSGSTTC